MSKIIYFIFLIIVTKLPQNIHEKMYIYEIHEK